MPRTAQPWYRKSDGWWYFSATNPAGRRKKIRLAKGRKNRQRAFDKFHEYMAKRAASPARSVAISLDDNPLAADVIDQFIGHSAANSAEKTHRWYSDFLNDFLSHLEDAGRLDIDAAELKVIHVTEWLNDRTEWSSSTKAGAVCSVRRAFRWATEQGIISAYPLFGLKAPRKATREVVISPAERRKILAAVKDQPFRDVLDFLWHTGCRPQEACRAEIRHFQKRHSRIVFPASEAKGKRAPRVIYLTPAALEIVVRAIGTRRDGPILVNSDGRAWTADAIKNRFKRMEKKVGARYCAYHFRHSFGTASLESGVDPITASVLMGHSDPSTLARTYQHLAKNPKHLLKAAGKVR